MSITKYRSVKDMEDMFWAKPGTLPHRRAIRFVLECVSFFAPVKNIPRGVFKFRSIQEASAQREAWERAHR